MMQAHYEACGTITVAIMASYTCEAQWPSGLMEMTGRDQREGEARQILHLPRDDPAGRRGAL